MTLTYHEVLESIKRVIGCQDYILGEDVTKFEEEVAAYLRVRHAVALNSGTDAFRIALSVMGIGKGDEVILPAFCFISDAACVALEGGTPVFVDIEPETCNLDLSQIEEKITERTRGIIPAHMYGMPIDMDPLMRIVSKHNLVLIEDACQAFGAMYKGKKLGSFGHFSGYSFYPTKPLACYGDAGLITTNDDGYAEKIRMIRNHGSRKKYYHEFLGFSSRMDTIQAAILRVHMRYFESRLEQLARLHVLYDLGLAGLDPSELRRPIECESSNRRGYSHYTIRTSKRDSLQSFLKNRGIVCGVFYPLSIHLQEAFSYLGYKQGDFPESERAQNEVLSLPFDMNTTERDVETVCIAIREYFR